MATIVAVAACLTVAADVAKSGEHDKSCAEKGEPLTNCSHDVKALKTATKNGDVIAILRHTAKCCTTENCKERSGTDLCDSGEDKLFMGDKINGNCKEDEQILSAQGLEQTTTIATGFKKIGFVPSRILASPYCRTLQTAKRVFPNIEAIPKEKLGRKSVGGTRECEVSGSGINWLIDEETKLVENTIMVTHSNCVTAALTGIADFRASGDENYGVAVFLRRAKPKELIGWVRRKDWKRLLAD